MKDYNLSIAFVGQLYDNAAGSTTFVYPEAGNTSWADSLGSDPRPALTSLGDVNKCYTIKLVHGGIVYAYRTLVDKRGGSNTAMVLLRASGPVLDGEKLVERLASLLDYALKQESKDQISNEVIKEKLSVLEELFDIERTPQVLSEENEHRQRAYRVYADDKELYKILQQPLQNEYKKYDCIHVVSKNENPHSTSIQRLDAPLEQVFLLKLPQGVEEQDGKRYVGKSECFTLIYKRQGYDDFSTGTLRLGGDSRYYSIEKDTIRVKSAEDANIKFRKMFQFRVTDENNRPIDKFSFKIKENGSNRWMSRPVGNNQTRDETIGQNGIISWPLQEGQYEYSINAEGYGKNNGQIDTRNSNQCDVILKPESDEQELYLIPAFYKNKKDDNSINEKVTLNYSKNNILYKKYCKSFGKYLSKPPVFYVTQKNPKSILILFCLLSFLVGLGAGILTKLNKEADNNTGGTNPSVECTEPIREEKPSETKGTPESVDTLELEDEKYLSENNVWERTKIKSEKYKKFFDILTFRDNEYASSLNAKNYKRLIDTDSCYSRITNEKWGEIRSKIKDALVNKDWKDVMTIRDKITSQTGYRDKVDLSLIISTNNETNPSHKTSTKTTVKQDSIPVI